MGVESYFWAGDNKTPGGNVRASNRRYHDWSGVKNFVKDQLLQDGHYDVSLTDGELHRIIVWLDCNSNYFSAYESEQQQLEGRFVAPWLE